MQYAHQVISVAMLRRRDDQTAAYLHCATIVNFIKKNLIIYSCSLLHYYQREIYKSLTLSTSTTVPAQLLLRSITITPASVPGGASYINNTKCEPKYTSAHLHICTSVRRIKRHSLLLPVLRRPSVGNTRRQRVWWGGGCCIRQCRYHPTP